MPARTRTNCEKLFAVLCSVAFFFCSPRIRQLEAGFENKKTADLAVQMKAIDNNFHNLAGGSEMQTPVEGGFCYFSVNHDLKLDMKFGQAHVQCNTIGEVFSTFNNFVSNVRMGITTLVCAAALTLNHTNTLMGCNEQNWFCCEC